jgi:hypothetical protein
VFVTSPLLGDGLLRLPLVIALRAANQLLGMQSAAFDDHRKFPNRHREWTSLEHLRNYHGMMLARRLAMANLMIFA